MTDLSCLCLKRMTKLIFTLEKNRHDAEAADAAGEETEEDVGGGDEPERKQVDHGVAESLSSRVLSVGPVDPVDPDTSSDEPAAEEEGDEGLDRMCGLGVLVTSGLRSPHSAQHSDEIFKCRERS